MKLALLFVSVCLIAFAAAAGLSRLASKAAVPYGPSGISSIGRTPSEQNQRAQDMIGAVSAVAGSVMAQINQEAKLPISISNSRSPLRGQNFSSAGGR